MISAVFIVNLVDDFCSNFKEILWI